jgi:nitrite reductase/ring-hydroxylating ferredoxin subunit
MADMQAADKMGKLPVALCPLADIADGCSRGFDPTNVGHDTMFVVRRGQKIYGYRNSCPHIDGAKMAWKRNEYLDGSGTRIVCGAHGALFRIEDGLCEVGPCVGQKLTAVRTLVLNGELLLIDTAA